MLKFQPFKKVKSVLVGTNRDFEHIDVFRHKPRFRFNKDFVTLTDFMISVILPAL